MDSWRRQVLEIFLRWKFRPWALLTPIALLVITLPLLRPLVHPGAAGDGERLLIATARSLVEGGRMELRGADWRDPSGRSASGVIDVEGRLYAARPPVFAGCLAGAAWMIGLAGVDADRDATLWTYLLTLISTTLPVAVGAGMLYRMGRLFELSRPWRAILAMVATFSGSWLSYSTVINPHAPAAALLLCACASVLFVGAARKPGNVLAILLLAGALAALASAISPWTLPLTLPLPLVFLSMQIKPRQKVIGMVLLTLGAAPIVWLHCAWSLSMFGSIVPPTIGNVLFDVAGADAADEGPLTRLLNLTGNVIRLLLGGHGLLTHSPLTIASAWGLFLVLRKHWPAHAKMLAAVSLVGTTTVVMMVAARGNAVDGRMFGVEWFVAFIPLLLFWTGAVIRRELSGWQRWAIAGLTAIGIVFSVAGARNPLPERAYQSYTAFEAVGRWFVDKASD
jgi:hypothetical protein